MSKDQERYNRLSEKCDLILSELADMREYLESIHNLKVYAETHL